MDKALWFAMGAFLVADCSSSQESGPSTNRLARESSPYLLLHATNPVDWYPWGQEAIQRARDESKPIFLSIGYSTCYWCHVMEEGVFSNPEIAALMNAGFINIKVDREERPDLDEIYMTATQLIQRRGGWPNSVFLTPELKPFFAGTYFPPEDRPGMTGFPTVLGRVGELWDNDRERLLDSAERVTEAMREMITTRNAPTADVPSREPVVRAVDSLKQSFDATWGGFGPAPKFPSPSNFFLLWEEASKGDAEARRIVVESLHHMGQGALYDHLGGGFHRYATDREWRVPHFEKMLYDNAFLAEIYMMVAEAERDPELARFARGTLDFVLARLTEAQGGFRSAIDAQTDGKEGAYYLWSREELDSLLTEEELALLGPIFDFDTEPNFEEHFYTLHLTDSLESHAARRGTSLEDLLSRMEPALAKLRAARETREFPMVDDKVLTDWNGMMIAAMARGGRLFEEPIYLRTAERAAEFLLSELKGPEGGLLHSFRGGTAKVEAFLSDYAYFARGLLQLYRVTEEPKWLHQAERLMEEMESRLRDPQGGYFQGRPDPYLLFQPKGILDGAIPSANGIAIETLLELAEASGKELYRERAEAAMRAFGTELQQYPEAAKTLALNLSRYHGPRDAAQTAPATADSPGSSMTALAQSVVEASIEALSPPTSLDWRSFELTMKIRDGWHVNANPASESYLIPTEVQGAVRDVRYPQGRSFRFSFADGELAVYDGELVIRGQVGAEASSLVLVYQACDDQRCLSPVKKELPLPK